MNTYFRPGVTTLDKLMRDRESFEAMSRRRAEHDAQILKDMDAEIAALKAEQVQEAKSEQAV